MFAHRLASVASVLLLLLVPVGCAEYSTVPLKTDLLSPQEVEARYNLNAQWWKAYNDPILDALIERALEANVDLAQSAIDVNRALYRAELLEEDLVPAFTADGAASSRKSIRTGDAAVRAFEAGLDVGYEIDLWQRLRNAASAQEWEYLATVEDRETARLALINSTADAYFRLRYLDQAVRLTEVEVERYRRLLDLTRTRYELGKVPGVEPLQSEQSLLASRTRLDNLRTQRVTVRQTLRDLLDLRPGKDPALPEGDLMAVIGPGVDLDVPVSALAARPDIRAAENRLQGAFRSLEAERASWYPTITVGGALGVSSDRSSNLFHLPLLSGNVRLNLPFLQWNTLRWNIRISEADFESARLDFEERITTALNEVQAACLTYAAAQRILADTAAKHEKDVRISAYYRNRYELGAGELKDLLEALNTEDASRLAALEAKYSLISAENAVYKAMGGRYERRMQTTE